MFYFLTIKSKEHTTTIVAIAIAHSPFQVSMNCYDNLPGVIYALDVKTYNPIQIIFSYN